MKVTNKKKIGSAMWVLQCPLCGDILASTSEKEYLPDYSLCDCDRNENKQAVYELFDVCDKKMIRRTKPPRFVGEITFGQLSDIENIEWVDEGSISEMTSALRKAGEFLLKSTKDGIKR
ncbi:hypothetical protein [Bacteroides sp.]|uniref:hypothetical protein n=1 Tax=Bacteroides sp. TaxID=29523 RepID=UPI0026246B2B|nr:hypothetical protein [Bacteroides sp.]MDD3040895.1 hypothetical protein [Bacteroides sp.]